MIKTITNCDGCGTDISYTANSIDYRLSLNNERIHSRGDGPVTDMNIEPDIRRTHHFCDLQCLRKWLGQSLK